MHFVYGLFFIIVDFGFWSSEMLKTLLLCVSEEEECVLILPDPDTRPIENLLNMIHGKVSSEECGTVLTPCLTWIAGLWRTCST
jgi:hypothetical protein